MPAYIIAEFGALETAVHIARLERNRTGSFGERMIVDTGRCQPLVGDWAPERMVVLEFPTLESAQAWWAARERSAPARLKPVKRNMILVEGL